MAQPLPQGFVLDPEPDRTPVVPPGFTLDEKPSVGSLLKDTAMPAFNEGLAGMLDLPLTAVNAAMERAGLSAEGKPMGGIGSLPPVGGVGSIRQSMEAVGVNTQPDVSTPGRETIAAGARGTGAGAMFGPQGMFTGALAGLVSELVKELGGGPVAQTVGGVAGGIGAGGITNTVRKTVLAATGAKGNPTLEAMRKEGVTPRMVGDVVDKHALKQTTAFLEGAPLTGGIVKKAAMETNDEIAAAVERRSASFGGGTTPAEAGTAITAGVENYATRVGLIATKMHNRLRKFVADGTPVQAFDTRTAVSELTTVMGELKKTSVALTPGLFKNLADDLALAENFSPRFSTMSALRTEVGKRLTDPMLVDDAGRGNLKKLYGALTKDIEVAAENISPRALTEFKKTKGFYKKQMDFIDDAFQRFSQAGVTPENMYQWAVSEGKIGATRLAALRKAMGRDAFGVVSSTVLRRMGNGGKDTGFDAPTFFSQWKNLSPDAKKTLFGGPGWEGYAESVDRIAFLSKQLAGTSRLANTSRTAGSAQLLAWLGGIAGGVVSGTTGAAAGVGTAIVTQATASKLLTSPSFAIWLATPVGANALANHIKLLPAIAYNEPQIEEALGEFVTAIGEQFPSDNKENAGGSQPIQ